MKAVSSPKTFKRKLKGPNCCSPTYVDTNSLSRFGQVLYRILRLERFQGDSPVANFLCFFVGSLLVIFVCLCVGGLASGPRVKLGSCKSALTPPPPLRWFILLAVLERWSRC